MTKWILLGFGGFCTVTGFITFWLPIPIGLPLMLVGVPILVRNSIRARRILVLFLRRFPTLRKKLRPR